MILRTRIILLLFKFTTKLSSEKKKEQTWRNLIFENLVKLNRRALILHQYIRCFIEYFYNENIREESFFFKTSSSWNNKKRRAYYFSRSCLQKNDDIITWDKKLIMLTDPIMKWNNLNQYSKVDYLFHG